MKRSNHLYRAYDNQAERMVAIKVSPNLRQGANEARVMRSYRTHPNLPKYYDLIYERNLAHIVMEFVAGVRLNYPKGGPKRSPELAVAISLQILKGLRHLHDKGILHYDIAHHNILINGDDPKTVKIVDFGGSLRKRRHHHWRSNRAGGTVNFRPPEQRWAPTTLYANADLYSVARLCYWLMKRSLPKRDEKIVLDDPVLQRILRKGMANEPDKRFQSAQQFMATLERW